MSEKQRNENAPVGSEADEQQALAIAEQTDLSVNQARDLLRRHGNDRDKVLEIAKTMKAES